MKIFAAMTMLVAAAAAAAVLPTAPPTDVNKTDVSTLPEIAKHTTQITTPVTASWNPQCIDYQGYRDMTNVPSKHTIYCDVSVFGEVDMIEEVSMVGHRLKIDGRVV
ncbi:hypothetical protein BC938DRAFT_481147 [Jimgerdemannia flammicorona]|uniref:Uncharacterized protein n=1 Tax=Jimgerdemannia flammicorona TaxID=994334 RepID=A0A433QWZ5_9FUNG|nr:hypothetical protein BC938DRAFT_481147 [Jimgerdemannia flammicorona]